MKEVLSFIDAITTITLPFIAYYYYLIYWKKVEKHNISDWLDLANYAYWYSLIWSAVFRLSIYYYSLY